MKKVRKAVIPAAGLGTRVLPATKSMPKEMLPIVDTPAIQYIVEEAVQAGIEDILIITNRGKEIIEDHFDHSIELEERLAGFLHQEGAMTFSTGFQSNLGIISALVGRNDYVILDKEDHASIYDACRLSYGKLLRYEHNDMEALERCLQRVPESAAVDESV